MLTVDRIEGETAVCINENNASVVVALDKLPKDISEGDIIFCENGIYFIDSKATSDRYKSMSDKMNNLFKCKNNIR